MKISKHIRTQLTPHSHFVGPIVFIISAYDDVYGESSVELAWRLKLEMVIPWPTTTNVSRMSLQNHQPQHMISPEVYSQYFL